LPSNELCPPCMFVMNREVTPIYSLQRELESYRRFRIGKFRIIYRVMVKEVEIVAVGPRRTIYEETTKLMKQNDDRSG